MSHALSLAEEAYHALEVPIGCVVICPMEKWPSSILLMEEDEQQPIHSLGEFLVVGRGRNSTMTSCNATRHAEIEAIDQMMQRWSSRVAMIPWHECSLYVTVEPCIMCIAALAELGKKTTKLIDFIGMKEIVFGCHNDRFGGCGSTMKLPPGYHSMGDLPMVIRHGILAKEAIMLLRRFYIRENKSAPKPRKKDNRLLKSVAE